MKPAPVLDLSRLNPPQRQAVEAGDGPLLVLAGGWPGPLSSSPATRRCAAAGASASAICWWTSTRTPTSPSWQGEARDLEEERRLAYVGMTRAREVLWLTRAAARPRRRRRGVSDLGRPHPLDKWASLL
jgi:superfamily I DNA/RNA helicase